MPRGLRLGKSLLLSTYLCWLTVATWWTFRAYLGDVWWKPFTCFPGRFFWPDTGHAVNWYEWQGQFGGRDTDSSKAGSNYLTLGRGEHTTLPRSDEFQSLLACAGVRLATHRDEMRSIPLLMPEVICSLEDWLPRWKPGNRWSVWDGIKSMRRQCPARAVCGHVRALRVARSSGQRGVENVKGQREIHLVRQSFNFNGCSTICPAKKSMCLGPCRKSSKKFSNWLTLTQIISLKH